MKMVQGLPWKSILLKLHIIQRIGTVFQKYILPYPRNTSGNLMKRLLQSGKSMKPVFAPGWISTIPYRNHPPIPSPLTQRIFDFLKMAESGNATGEKIREMASFAASRNLISLSAEFEHQAEETQCGILARALNRPIRVCGMVR